ncbi:long chain acyl-CoA synthetase 9, chloroplastic-like isoform X2 [Vicia villosa]|uniref:long chain acyl-CoA synthetase 9, chloroplastic-like isoform X2 n=1 Tax=Vicia villosa TaxID=3911 RepID=UPI00273ABDDF|nr:long chain acyl-CoA synthetase 9, chloroplastic-like isoform X2 [Vicia villosa]
MNIFTLFLLLCVFLFFQACFRRNVTKVLRSAFRFVFMGCNTLITEVTTVICGPKELKSLVHILGQLDFVKHLICIDNDLPYDASSAQHGWKLTSFFDVERLGRENPVAADLPLSADVPIIMYTSGSTCLPKVVWVLHFALAAAV